MFKRIRPARHVARSRSAAIAFAFLLATGLSACGGDDKSLDPPPLTLSPSFTSVTTIHRRVGSISVTATLRNDVANSNPYVRIGSTDQLLAEDFTIDVKSNNSAMLTFNTLRTLDVGKHSGRLDFYVCKDSACSEMYSSTPAVLRFDVIVEAAPPAAVITPTSLTATVEAGDPAQIEIEAQILTGINAGGFAVHDADARFASEVNAQTIDGTRYAIILNWAPNDVPGTYSGTIELLVCSSYFCSQDNQEPGSPVTIPYVVTVTPQTLLQPLPTASGLPEWETHQGNAAHTGFVSTVIDAAAISHRWTWNLPQGYENLTLSPITTGGGRALVSISGYFSPSALVAIDEASGTTAWQHDFGSVFRLNPPATFGGRIFVATSGHEDTYMWSFDIDDGELKFKVPFDSQWEHYLAPTVKNSVVYTNGGYYGGMYAFKATTGVNRWFAGLGQYALWTPAVDDTMAYAYTGYEFSALDLQTGSNVLSIPDPSFNWWGYSLNMAPVLPGDGTVLLVNGIYDYGYAHSNELIRYSTVEMRALWRVNGGFASDPVVAPGMLYVVDGVANQLQARDQSTGALLWTWSPTGNSETLVVGNLVLTDNLIFVATNQSTYALDLTTHSSVWSAPHTGNLALSSNKILYISAGDRIDAYNLF